MPLSRLSAAAALAGAALLAAPAPAGAATWNLLTFGDWGTGSALQKSNAAAINAYCAAHPPDLVLSLGDQFYNGPNTTWDPRWRMYPRQPAPPSPLLPTH